MKRRFFSSLSPLEFNRRKCRYRFLDAAFEVFLELGFENVTMSDVIRRSGGSFSTIYKFFGNKESLFAAALKYKIDEVFNVFQSVAERQGEDNERRFLEEFGLKALELSISDKSVMMFRLAISEGHKNGGKLGQIFIEQSFNGAIKVLSDYITKKQLEGVFKTMNPRTAATRFFLMIKEPYGFIMLITGQKPEFSEEQKIKLVRDAVDFFLRGIAAR